MTTIHETASYAAEDDENRKREVAAHLLDMWAFKGIDSSSLTPEQVMQDLETAQQEVNHDETDAL